MTNQPHRQAPGPPAGGTPAPQGADSWSAYFDAVAGLPPRETLLFALDRSPEPGFAIDLGSGEGRDTRELLRRGWRVLAIDSSPEAIARLLAATPDAPQRQLETRVATFETADLPPCDLLNASFSIPHCDPRDFPGVWSRIVRSIRPRGRFAGQLFGVNDSWAKNPDGITRTYHTRAEVESLLAPFEIEMLDEVERPGKNALGEPKYWHAFHVVGRKR